MAPPRHKKPATEEAREQGREVKLRMPEDLMEWIEERAKKETRPINRIIINLIARVPDWEQVAHLDEVSRHYETMLAKAEVSFARYSSEIAWQILSRDLLKAVDEVLEAGDDSALRARLAKLRAVRIDMLTQERERKVREETGLLPQKKSGGAAA